MTIDPELVSATIERAREARRSAYSPYSGYAVGAAVLGGSGAIYGGCNVENASYSLSVCAERCAVFNAVSCGEKKIKALAFLTADFEPAAPCGACLQVLAEFAEPIEGLAIIAATEAGGFETKSLSDYLPRPFKLR